jgi:hypothetical protein
MACMRPHSKVAGTRQSGPSTRSSAKSGDGDLMLQRLPVGLALA